VSCLVSSLPSPFVCTEAPTAPAPPAFGNFSWAPGEEGPVFSWDYWGPERNVYLEYVLKNSKHEQTSMFYVERLVLQKGGGGKRVLLLIYFGVRAQVCNKLVKLGPVL